MIKLAFRKPTRPSLNLKRSSKPHQSSLTLKFFLKSTRPSLPLKKGLSKPHQSSLTLKFFLKSTRPSLPLKKGLSKTHQSSLTLKGGSTAFPKPLSPQGTGDVPTALLGAQTATLYGWRTIRGLRQQQSCSFLCGMNRRDTMQDA